VALTKKRYEVKSNRCPICGSDETEMLPRRLRTDEFMIRAPIRCRMCGIAFSPPSGIATRILTLLVALVFGIGVVFMYLIPSVRELWRGDATLGNFVSLAIALISIPFFLKIGGSSISSGNTFLLFPREDEDEVTSDKV